VPAPLAKLIKPLASLRLTVAVMVALMVLIFAGTLAQTRHGIWHVIDVYFRAPLVWVPLDLFVAGDAELPGRFPFPGGLTLGVLLLFNLLAAHALRFRVSASGSRLLAGLAVLLSGVGLLAWYHVRPPVPEFGVFYGLRLLHPLALAAWAAIVASLWLLFHRRAGIVLIHAALIVLIAGEFATRVTSHESQMPVYAGTTVNYTVSDRAVELAFVEPTGEGDDRVVAIPGKLLIEAHETGKPIEHEALPFAVRVIEWYENARLMNREVAPQLPQVATHGFGVAVFPREAKPISGVDPNRRNNTTALVGLERDGEPIARMVVSIGLGEAAYRPRMQPVPVAGRDITVALRPTRFYKPYAVTLDRFEHDLYPGSNTPLNYASNVTLADPRFGERRQHRIWMNHPLRYRGETFYQAAFRSAEEGLPVATVLQVVRNPASALPYIAITGGGLGLLLHFGLSLARFRRRETARATRGPEKTGPDRFPPRFPPRSPPATELGAPHRGAVNEPVPFFQRVVPWAIAGLLVAIAAGYVLRPKNDPGPFDEQRFAALPVVFDGRAKPMAAVGRNTLLSLRGKGFVEVGGERLSSTRWLMDVLFKRHTADDYPVFRIEHEDVQAMVGLPNGGDPRDYTFHELMPSFERVEEQARAAAKVPQTQRTAFHTNVIELDRKLKQYVTIATHHGLYSVPAAEADGPWLSWASIHTDPRRPEPAAAVHAGYEAMLRAYNAGDTGGFNAAAAATAEALGDRAPELARKAAIESAMMRAGLFTQAMVLYVGVGVLVVLSWMLPGGAGRAVLRAAAVTAAVALLLHTVGLGLRVYLSGRPPVTNLYSSAVFVGWAVAAIGLPLERYLKMGLGLIPAAVAGFSTLLVADALSADGDTLAVMQAVLDSNFWLATHVVTITLGYSAMFLAALFGMLFILLGVCTPWLKPWLAKRLTQVTYGTVCFAVLLSFIGTLLGGVWADQSWGRFWGWDPKENGALLIVLWCAVVLHARLGGMVRQRGLAALAVIGSIVTMWSWFGTNMLGVGLHSYGFINSARFWLLLAISLHIVIVSLATLPLSSWWSFPHLARAHGVKRPPEPEPVDDDPPRSPGRGYAPKPAS